MDNIILWLGNSVPDIVWSILLFLAPANPIFQYIFGKMGYVPKK